VWYAGRDDPSKARFMNDKSELNREPFSMYFCNVEEVDIIMWNAGYRIARGLRTATALSVASKLHGLVRCVVLIVKGFSCMERKSCTSYKFAAYRS
jgi:hypothetical protein